MPTPALALLIAVLLPLAAFTILVFVGKRMGNPLAGVLGTLFIAGSFACSLWAMKSWLEGGSYVEPATQQLQQWGAGKGPINIPYQWIPVGAGLKQDHPGFLDLGIYVDSLTICMFSMITLVSMLVFVFSIGYMHEDKRFPRFFTYLGLFCFSMLGLVLGGTVIQLFVFWELVGLCSYLLIGFWYEKKSASNAAIKAFVTNRIGDFGFLIGFGILFYHLGNVTLPNLWAMLGTAGSGEAIKLANGTMFTTSLLTIMGIGLFFGAVGKSAQFPLHVWLPDAMEGPTPVSALIHAATMVAAGVYLVGRIFPILTPDAKLFIAIIGCITLTMAALIALAQTDIKKVLAYSTLSQLGYMILAMGIGSYIGGLFHLITHAFFKALLFLGSGSVIHAAHHEQELPQYGGLIRKIPITALTFLIAVFAIAGTPYFSGFYSKDLLLSHAGAFATLAQASGRSQAYWLLFILPVCIAFVTPFYMTRCWMLTFWGKPRNQHVFDHAHETTILWIPLVVLAVLSVIGGKFLGVQELIENSTKEADIICRRIEPKVWNTKNSVFATAWPGHPVGHEPKVAAEIAETVVKPQEHPSVENAEKDNDPFEHGEGLVKKYVFWAFAIGIGLGFFVYLNGYAIVAPLMKIPGANAIRIWLYRRMYFDELYFAVFVAIVMGASKLSAWFDKYIVDGLVNLVGWTVKQTAFGIGAHDKYVIDGAVNGVASLAQDLGAAVRAPQTGRIRMYVTVLMIAVAVGLAAAILVALS